MAAPSSPPDGTFPLNHLHTLYHLACTMVGPESAPDLLRHVAQQAAEAPPHDRPDDLREWHGALLRASRDEPPFPAPSASLPATTDDPDALQRAAADRIVEDVVPIALATCSPQERFLVAVAALEDGDAFGDAPISDEDGPPTGAGEILSNQLEDLLPPPEYTLVKETHSDEALLEAVQDLLTNRFPDVPGSLRTELEAILQSTDAAQEDAEDATDRTTLRDRLPARPTPRSLLFTLLLGLLVLAGGIGVSYLTPTSEPSGDPQPSLVAFSAERAPSVTPDLVTNSSAEAEAFVQSTWNRQVTVPSIEGAELRGVGRARTADAEIPVFLYADEGTRITAFAYNYALVERMKSAASLSSSMRRALAQSRHLVSGQKGTEEGLLWRDRDDIFVAVSPTLPPDSLRRRLQLQD